MTCWRATRRARRAVAVLSAFAFAVGSASLIASPAAATGDKPAEEASADTTSSIEPVPPGPDSLTEAVETGILSAEVVASLKNGPVEALVAVQYGDLTLGSLDVDVMRTARVQVAERKTDVFDGVTGVTVIEDYSALPISFVEVDTAAALLALVRTGDVVSVEPNLQYTRQLAESLPLIRQPQAQAAGHTGAGTAVAVLDSGLDYEEAAFGSCTSPGVPASCRVAYVQDFAPDDGVLDDDGHGTNVAGIVAGVAPGTKLIGLDVFDGASADSQHVIAAINWTVANRATYNITAINLSLGNSDHWTTTCTTPYNAAFSTARGAGIMPVVAAGNTANVGSVFQDGVAHPACAAGAVRVGAVYDSDVGGRASGELHRRIHRRRPDHLLLPIRTAAVRTGSGSAHHGRRDHHWRHLASSAPRRRCGSRHSCRASDGNRRPDPDGHRGVRPDDPRCRATQSRAIVSTCWTR